MTIYENLNRIREERRLSIRKVEIGAGLSIGSIDKWKTSIPGIDKLTKVAEFLGVPVTELLQGTDFEVADLPRAATEDEIRAAFFSGTGVPKEEQEELWQDAKEYIAFLSRKKKR